LPRRILTRPVGEKRGGFRGNHVPKTPPTRSLSGIEVFSGLDETERKRIEGRCRWRVYRTGERILESGSDSREVFFLVHGSASALNYSLSGREIAFATFSAGDYFGELAAIDAQPRSASIVASEESLVASMSGEEFLDVLRQRVEVTFKVFQRLAGMVRASDVRIMELSTLAASARVYSELLRMAKPEQAVPGMWVIHPLPPLREIASRASTTRETVNRAITQLYPTGLIRRKGRNLYVTDKAKLQLIIKELQHTGKGRD
jgi:CRP/FNR family transcriptional regulator, cyclic AMP receptor protein